MSAFVVTKATMHRVVSGILKEYGYSGNFAGLPLDGDAIGTALFEMNCDAVDQRYCETNPRPQYTWHPRGLTALEYYKAATCLRYQCAEGNVPETALFKALDNFCDRLAAEIITNLPAYNALPWDFPDDDRSAVIAITDFLPLP